MTRSLRQLSVLLMTAGVCSSADIAVAGNYTAWPFEFVGYNAPSANLTSIFGPKIAEVNAAAAGYSFGSPIDPLRNLNV
ncbi:MAG TPA: hypothetical protein VLM89_06265, partial [Phycisphaerae bacterium]|nr:hypothetical protein [Phycisphaerae bacterium]